MVSHMKTTVDISDHLLESAKRRAREDQRTLKELIEDGLRRVLADDAGQLPFKLRKVAPMQGSGLQPGLAEGDWETIRDISYGLK